MQENQRPGANRMIYYTGEKDDQIDFGDTGRVREEAKAYFDEHKEDFETVKKQTDDEIKAGSEDLVSKISLSDGSVYDRAFWMFFYEDNP
jgi:hypothetical protein